MLAPWWDRFPGRLDAELQALESAGIQCRRDESAFSDGRLIFSLTMPEGAPVDTLVAKFPDTYPYTRVEVYAPTTTLGRHQNPFHKNLCLLGRGSENWHVTDTLAATLESQLPQIFAAAAAPGLAEAAELEEPQGEPISVFYDCEPKSAVLVDSGWTIPPGITSGRLQIGVASWEPVRGAVLRITGDDDAVLASADPTWGRLYPERVTIRWARLPEPLLENNPERFFERLARLDPHAVRETWQHDAHLLAVSFPEEVKWRAHADGWLFVVRRRGNQKGFRPGKRIRASFARAERVGQIDLAVRLPSRLLMSELTIAVVGLGCLGAPSLLEFARAGVGGLRFLDRDSVEGGTIVRWPFGFGAIRYPKAEVLFKFIESEYPHTKLKGYVHHVGNPEQRDDDRDRRVLDDLLSGVDLVYDATAELGLQQLFSDLAGERKIPYVCVSATHGGWGGIVARARHDGSTGCWVCLQQALTNGTIPLPPADPAGVIQPQGCGALTFTGANFDLGEVALMGVRFALATVCSRKDPSYGDYAWEVAVLRLRNDDGARIEPQWQVFPLPANPQCSTCRV